MRTSYIKRLCSELQAHAPECTPLESIFVGGGTPSLLSPREWYDIFSCLHDYFILAPGYEWTMEANPESLTPQLIDAWAAAGVNRVSIGVQAFQEELRRTIGRRGTLAHLPMLLRKLRTAGIRRLNFDLIFNIPGQTLGQWRDSLMRSLDCGVTHLSAYALTLEEGTRLTQRTGTLPDDAFPLFWNMSDSVLATGGLRRYEISNFALPGEECRHNLEIWRGATYLGCGPAATSFDGLVRRSNRPSLQQWLDGAPPEIDSLPPEDRAAEILAFGMRVVSGWERHLFRERTGFDARTIRGPQLCELARLGLLTLTPDAAIPTPKGLLFNDEIAMRLI